MLMTRTSVRSFVVDARVTIDERSGAVIRLFVGS